VQGGRGAAHLARWQDASGTCAMDGTPATRGDRRSRATEEPWPSIPPQLRVLALMKVGATPASLPARPPPSSSTSPVPPGAVYPPHVNAPACTHAGPPLGAPPPPVLWRPEGALPIPRRGKEGWGVGLGPHGGRGN